VHSSDPVRSVGSNPLCGVGLPQDSFGLGGRNSLGYMEHEQHHYRPADCRSMERRQLPHPENDIFNHIDAHYDGAITFDELNKVVEAMGDSREVFNTIDLNHNGKISREAFARELHSRSQSCAS